MPYPTDGSQWYSGDAGATWTQRPTVVHNFEEWGRSEEILNPRTEYEIVNALLDSAKWSQDARDIDDSNPLEYAFWETASGQSVLSMIQVFESITGGIFYIDREGKAKWESAGYRSLNSAAPVVTMNNDMHDFSYDLDKRDIWNDIVVTTAPEQVVETDPVTEAKIIYYVRLRTTKYLDLGESYIATFSVSGYVDEWQTPTIRATLGLTTDISSQLDVSIIYSSRTMCKVQVTNNYRQGSWPDNVTLRNITVGYTKLVDEEQEEDIEPIDGEWGETYGVVEVEDTVSQTKYTYGLPRTKEVYVPFPMEYEIALNLALYYLAYFKDPVADTSLLVKNDSDAKLVAILDSVISNRITSIITGFFLNADFFVNKVSHRVGEGGLWHEVTWVLEKADTQRQLFVWDISTWDDGSVWGP